MAKGERKVLKFIYQDFLWGNYLKTKEVKYLKDKTGILDGIRISDCREITHIGN